MRTLDSMSIQILLTVVLCVGIANANVARADCFPECREGYVCSQRNECVSACNPVCPAGEMCWGGNCVAEAAPVLNGPAPSYDNTQTNTQDNIHNSGESGNAWGTSSPSESGNSSWGMEAPPEPPRHRDTYVAMGPQGFLATNGAVGLGVTGGHVFGAGKHGFLAGARLGFYFGDVTTVRFGADVGYHIRLSERELAISLAAMFQPTIFASGSLVVGGLGFGVAPTFGYRMFYAQIPIGFAVLLSSGDRYARDSAVAVVEIGALAGVRF